MEAMVKEALSNEYERFWMICDAASVVRNALHIKDWFAFEAVLNEYAPRYPQFLMCLRNLDRFSGEMVMNVLQTHPGSSSTG